MAIDEKDVRSTEGPSATGLGLLKGLGVTVKHLLQRSVTQQYPEVKPDLPPRTRGVIALKQENCTVCYKCSRECPDWCIYIDAHKETHPPASGGKARSVKVLDRFAIDFSLCMYCGICVEVCPFDALFWSPEFEYSEYSILDLIHEKERLEEWTYHVLPPPLLEIGAEQPPEPVPAGVPAPATSGEGAPAGGPLAAAAAAAPTPPSPAPAAAETPSPAPAAAETPSPAPAAAETPAPTRATSGSPPATSQAAAAPTQERVEVEPDQETFDAVLAEELAKGTDRRVAEGKARRAAMIEARKKAAG